VPPAEYNAPSPRTAMRLAWGVYGAFAVIGLCCLGIALCECVERVAFLCAATRVPATVIGMRAVQARVGSGTMAVAPVLAFKTADGQEAVVVSEGTVRASAYSVGDRPFVVYRSGQPGSAVIDAFLPLWQRSCVFASVGVFFMFLPVRLLAKFLRTRRQARVNGTA
jgi:hypothetical protein